MLKKQIGFTEAIQFIDSVVDTVFSYNEETDTYTYLPELYHYAYGLAVAHYFVDYEITSDPDQDYAAAINMLEQLEQEETSVQLQELSEEIKEKIYSRRKHIVDSKIVTTAQFDELVPYVESFLNHLNAKIEGIDVKKINKALGSFNVKKLVDEYVKASGKE